ncbi:Eco57I restriction-modification methylase domain-containing protein [Methylomonas methanica]|uniref:Eco57I restriction-modification methylase domain-containing protein n=1 Tax=Methylomonas methanica TaxID=421 RepID=UPI0007C89B7C|nr:Eco57I restriction-modification methylase domain-containing protein [Methylomonas methanica]
MTIDPSRFQKLLNDFKLEQLFNELGWDRSTMKPQPITVNGDNFTLAQLAHKRGVAVFRCSPDITGKVPARPLLIKIEKEAAKLAHEHLLVFADASETMLTWLWVSRAPGQPTTTRSHTWHKGQSGESLRQKLSQIVWSLEEEEAITLTDVITGLRKAFDRDRISKSFYDKFKAQHEAFADFIDGLDAASDNAWYASLMLNRLMFVYFIQKKGFLDGDENYLANRMAEVQEAAGKGKFHSFYRQFLRRLFHEGLGQARADRNPELKRLIGDVPYLNGGLFSLHELEEANPGIDVPDEAFERLFAFFDAWEWHLDDRPLSSGKEINPDVLGYIFEKYINQKQMGAYYTKEDITEYISKNTVIPHLIEQARERCKVAFDGDVSVWNLLQADPDRYIYTAMKTGVIDAAGNLVPESALPDFVQTGMKDAQARMFDKRYKHGEAIFYTATGERGTLPTETWRECVERRGRCLAVRDKLAAGEVKSADDLITMNLDIRQFMQDVIDTCTSPDLLRSVWQAIVGREPEKANEKFRHGITILDPTCGSGAFLFAALNILEPLYEACLERMEGFIEDAKKLGKVGEADFVKVLAEVDKHPSRSYYIFKSIILHNLFGVDIMAEAVEICKLRLFLKLVSQVDVGRELEPLPDIDFNIRAGNTLVGYATEAQFDAANTLLVSDLSHHNDIKARTADLADLFESFRERQTVHGGKVTAEDKFNLRNKLSTLSLELDRYLARDYGIDPEKTKAFNSWRESHQPFHWFAEFYGVMREGGVDVVIGNPPYVAARKVTSYTVRCYKTAACTDIYAWCLERVTDIASQKARTGMIVPLSLSFSGDFDGLRQMLYQRYQLNWFSHFAKRPSMLFSGVQIRNAIHIGRIGDTNEKSYTTKLHRWHSEARFHLFNQLCYSGFSTGAWNCVPKAQGDALLSLIEQKISSGMRLQTILSRRPTSFPIYFKKIGYNWISFGEFIPPAYSQTGQLIEQNEFGVAYVNSRSEQEMALLFLNGKIAFAYWILVGDDFHLTKGNFADAPFDFSKFSVDSKSELSRLAAKLSIQMKDSVVYMTMHGKRLGNFNATLCRAITEESDQIFAKELGLIHVWDEIELLHSQIVRTSADTDADEEE